MPVLAAYIYWNFHQNYAYINELKRSEREASSALANSLDEEVNAQEWGRIRDQFREMDAEGTRSALLQKDGKLWFALPDFPRELVAAADVQLTQREFGPMERGRSWFCELVPLKNPRGELIGYLLEVQDWTSVARESYTQTIAPLVVALVLMAMVATVIPLTVHYYVTRPLADLSARATRLPVDDSDRSAVNEVELLSGEFRKLDQQLTRARSDLHQRHRRELELERELQRADRLATIGTLAAGLAHEIGTPLGVIRVRAEELQQDDTISADSRGKLGVVVRQIDRIARIVRMLLDYARKKESAKTICDLRTIADRALALLAPEAARRNVRTIAELGESSLLVQCDADQLEQVFVNLITNALDSMQRTGGTLRVAAQTQSSPEGWRALLAFEDTGEGVAPEYEDRVFAPFFTTKEPGKGTGMGLAVSQSIVREHHGEINFTSGPSGTRFVIAIPLITNQTIEADIGPREQRRA